MVPKKTAVVMKIYRSILFFQKSKLIRKGSPVCAEKNKSPPKANLLIQPVGLDEKSISPGKGPIWVSVINIERTKINRAILLSTKGILFG